MSFNVLSMFGPDASLSDLISIVPIAGMLIVFAMLILLVAIISVFGGVMKNVNGSGKNEKKTEKSVAPAPVAPIVHATTASDDDELIAVIAAAVDAMYSGTQKRAIIRAIKPSTQSRRGAWGQAGVRNNIRAF